MAKRSMQEIHRFYLLNQEKSVNLRQFSGFKEYNTIVA